MTMKTISGEAQLEGQNQDMLTFRLGKQNLALPVESIDQIIPIVTITPLPTIDRSVLGTITVRGSFVPVIDLRVQLGLPPTLLKLYTPIILIRLANRTLGLVVDEVNEVISLPAKQLVRLADVIPEGIRQGSMLQGMVKVSDAMLPLLDIYCLFSSEQLQALDAAMQSLDQTQAEHE